MPECQSQRPSATILPFPQRRIPALPELVEGSPAARPAPEPPAPEPESRFVQPGHFIELGQRGRYCGILYIARALRLEARDLRTVVHHVRAHIASTRFPAPVNSRLRRGQPLSGADLVSPKSEWLRAAVDQWVAASQEPPEQAAMQQAMQAQRAAQIDATLAGRFGAGA